MNEEKNISGNTSSETIFPKILFKDIFHRPGFGIFALNLDIPRVHFLLQTAHMLNEGRSFFQWATLEKPLNTGMIFFRETPERFRRKQEILSAIYKTETSSPIKTKFVSPTDDFVKAVEVHRQLDEFINENPHLDTIIIEGLYALSYGREAAYAWRKIRDIAERYNLFIIGDYQSHGYYDYQNNDSQTCLRKPLSHTEVIHPNDIRNIPLADWIFSLLQVPQKIFKQIVPVRTEEINESNNCLIGKFLSCETNVPHNLQFFQLTKRNIIKMIC